MAREVGDRDIKYLLIDDYAGTIEVFDTIDEVGRQISEGAASDNEEFSRYFKSNCKVYTVIDRFELSLGNYSSKIVPLKTK